VSSLPQLGDSDASMEVGSVKTRWGFPSLLRKEVRKTTWTESERDKSGTETSVPNPVMVWETVLL
jgi:hypothetical protein